MAYPTLRVPQPEIERVAKTGVELASIAKDLLALAKVADGKDKSLADGLRVGASRVLDQAEVIANAVAVSNYLNA